ncbi:MAG: RNA polymerase sigma factor [Bacteroides sp.]|nr:RNA polymerase sigma factor [Bacteroides sp.]
MMNIDSAVQTDKDIVSALKKDAERGFRLLMARYKEPVYWHIRRLVVSHDDAQDAAQETFVRVFRSFSQFRGECPFAVWVYRIATNEALRMLDKQWAGQISLDAAGASVDSLMADEYVDYNDLEAVKLQKALLALPTKQQLAFNLRYYDGMGYEEIAQITGSTAANVKANYHIAKEKIIKYMNSMV